MGKRYERCSGYGERMKLLVTADIHLTDRPDDEYRWGLFDWIKEQCVKHQVGHLFILGDLTDSKDRHSAILTNRVTQELEKVGRSITKDKYNENVVHVLMGNHDFIDSNNPFFDYLSYIPRVKFYSKPDIVEAAGGMCLIGMLPFYRDDVEFYKEAKKLYDSVDDEMSLMFMHQTLKGSLLSNGSKMDSGLDVDSKVLNKMRCRIFSGDVHVPQKIGKVEYVGSPYQIKFGDDFTPRVLLLDTKNLKSVTELNFQCMQKWTFDVTDVTGLIKQCKDNIAEGDRVKVRMAIHKRDIPESGAIRREASDAVIKHGGILDSLTLSVTEERKRLRKRGEGVDDVKPSTSMSKIDLFNKFCSHKNISDNLRKVGLEMLKE